MKICQINNFYEPFARGGAEVLVRTVGRQAQATAHQVFIISAAPSPLSNRETEAGTVIYTEAPWLFSDANSINRLKRLGRQLFGSQTAGFCVKTIKEIKPDLIISHNTYGMGLKLLSALSKTGIPHIHILHDLQLLYPSGLIYAGHENSVNSLPAVFYQGLVKKHSRNFKKVVSPSQWLLDWHMSRGFWPEAEQVKLLNPGPEIKYTPRPPRDVFKLLYVGQLEKHKGFETLLNAWPSLKAAGCSLDVVGDGSLAKAAQARVGGQFFYHGRLNSEAVAELMSRSHLFVMPSLVWENAPLVLTESKANGLPSIGSNLGGVAEMIADRDRLFEPGSVQDLVKTVRLVMSRYNEYLKPPSSAMTAALYLESLLML